MGLFDFGLVNLGMGISISMENSLEEKQTMVSNAVCDTAINNRWSRDEKEDIHTALDLCFELRQKLKDLHPNAEGYMRNLLRDGLFL